MERPLRGGLTLIQSTAELKDVEDDEDEVEKTDVAPKTAEDDPVEDLSIKDAAILLAAGLGAGAVIAFGFNTFNSAVEVTRQVESSTNVALCTAL